MRNLTKILLLGIVYLTFIPSPVQAVYLGDIFAFGYGNKIKNLGDFISFLINPAFAIAGILVGFYVLTAAFNYINSQGDKNAVQASRERIIHAIIGLLLLLAAFILIKYLPTALGLVGVSSIIN